MDEGFVVVRDLSKSYGSIQALRGVSLEVARGEWFGLLGPNGAGKTTFLALLTGLLPPDRGEVRIAGLPLRGHRRRILGRIGLVPQELALYPTLSARENLTFFGRLYGLGGRALRRRIEAVLEAVGLRDRADDRVETYSGGMKRRLNLAAALLHEPELLLLDEPTVGVDPQSRNRIFELLKGLQARGVTLIYTTHYMEEAQRWCDRVAILDRGEILALDAPRRLIERFGVGRVRVQLDGADPHPLAEALRRRPGVEALRIVPGGLEVESARPRPVLETVLELGRRLSLPLTGVEVREPDLEAVFLRLTGRALRD